MKQRGQDYAGNRKSISIPSLIGIVLTGGESRRMGSDKAELQYHNKSQHQHLLELLSAHCDAAFLSCNAEQEPRFSDIPHITDLYPGAGPMGGILSAFQSYPEHALLTVPCDMPYLDSETIAYLIKSRNPARMATTFWNPSANFPEPLVTIWEPEAKVILSDFMSLNRRGPSQVLAHCDIEIVQILDVKTLRNINTREESLTTLRQLRGH